MKTAKNNEGSVKIEFFKRILYSFQVLMVGIALPLLFLIGISDGNQKKMPETNVREIMNLTPLSAKPVIGLYMPGV